MAERTTIVNAQVEGDKLTAGMIETESKVSKGTGADKEVFAEGLKHNLDFTGTTLNELMHLATATVVISLQRTWRELGSKCKTEHGKSTNVHEFINRPVNRTMRPAEDIVLEKAEKGELSPEQLQDLIEKLQAKLNK